MENLKRTVRSSPFIYLNYQLLKPSKRKLVVTRNTNLVVEGFPRCANSYTVHLIEYLLKKHNISDFKIGHHLHSIAQIKRAKKHNIPCVILIRDPTQAIASYLIRSNMSSVNQLLKEYLHFYTKISEINFQFVLVDFNEVISDINILINRVNLRFNLDLPLFIERDKDEVINYMTRVSEEKYSNNRSKYSVPNREKEIEKKLVLKQINDSEKNNLLREASELYNELKLTFIEK
ncbi:hypothetical protein [Ekhidna sp.]|uniref:hypothetical protein n=1 Tax=Ekhidna sp. TaxID=2608089 RepID=UPI003BA889EA